MVALGLWAFKWGYYSLMIAFNISEILVCTFFFITICVSDWTKVKPEEEEAACETDFEGGDLEENKSLIKGEGEEATDVEAGGNNDIEKIVNPKAEENVGKA